MRKMTPEEALEYHSRGRKGKIEVVPSKPCRTQEDLSLAYSPGVAEPCLEIAKDPEKVYEYTAKGNLVAVDLQRHGGPRPRQHRPARRQARHGGQGRPLQAVRRHRRLRHRGRRRRRRRVRRHRRADRADVRRDQPRGRQVPGVLRDRGAAQEAPPDPGLPRRPARHGDHLGRGVPERARGRRQEDRQRQGRLLRRGRLGDRLREALPLLRRAAREPAHGGQVGRHLPRPRRRT